MKITLMASAHGLASILLLAGSAAAQAADSLPRVVAANVPGMPYNSQSGGIAAFDVQVDEKGAVAAVENVQDVAPYGAVLGQAASGWHFEPARSGGRAVRSRVLVLGLFRPPALSFAVPDSPRYKSTEAPAELPWPTAVVVPPYPPNALGSGTVIMEVDVSDAGAVTATRVLSPAGAFDSAAADSVRQWKFRPAGHGNQQVRSRLVFVATFSGTT